MQIPIIKRRERHEDEHYDLCYQSPEHVSSSGRFNCGYGFPCTPQGSLKVDMLSDCALGSLYDCIHGRSGLEKWGVQRYVNRWVEPTVGECYCGHHIELAAFTNTCERCNRDYSMDGSLLASREQWGEETGETYHDVLEAGHHIS